MEDKDVLYRMMFELKKRQSAGKLSMKTMNELLYPLSVQNEKEQDEYAAELLSILKTSTEEEDILQRVQMCLCLLREEQQTKRLLDADDRNAGKGREEKTGAAGFRCEGTVYLKEFALPIQNEEQLCAELAGYNGGSFGYIDNAYPCGIFSAKNLDKISFSGLTVLYGGNGSGKSTLLNLIANRLELNRIAPYNSGEMFDRYTGACTYELGFDEDGFRMRIPSGSRIITSDDVFDYMLTMRTRNDEIGEDKIKSRDAYAELKYGKNVHYRGEEDYEALRLQVMARSKSVSRRKFIQKTAGEEVRLNSNGETALSYFKSKIKSKTLYCLDEPENSLSPAMQLQLAELLQQKVDEEECQLILSTHSPFLLAMKGAVVYDLDSVPAQVRPWWNLENTRIYYEFFRKYKNLFEQ